MFGIPKLLPLCLFSLGLISMLPLSLLFQTPFSYFHSRRKRRGRAAPVIGKFSDAALKWFFFASLGHDVQRALFHIAHRKSQWQMWKSFHRLTLHLHSTLNGVALHHSLFPRTVVTWPFKPSRKFGTHGCLLWRLQLCLRLRMPVFVWGHDDLSVLLTCKCCRAETWIHSISGAFNETRL